MMRLALAPVSYDYFAKLSHFLSTQVAPCGLLPFTRSDLT